MKGTYKVIYASAAMDDLRAIYFQKLFLKINNIFTLIRNFTIVIYTDRNQSIKLRCPVFGNRETDVKLSKGEVNIYSHKEVVDILSDMVDKLLLQKETRFIGNRLHFIVISDGEERIINDRKVSFFDILSAKTKQFGFSMELDDGERLTCCGDEPYNPCEERYVRNCKWLLHEAFCLFSEADIFAPYEKHHSTVKEACELAEKLNVQNLIRNLYYIHICGIFSLILI